MYTCMNIYMYVRMHLYVCMYAYKSVCTYRKLTGTVEDSNWMKQYLSAEEIVEVQVPEPPPFKKKKQAQILSNFVSLSVCSYVRVCVRVCIVQRRMCAKEACVIYMYTCTYMYMRVYVLVCVCVCVCTSVCVPRM